MTIKATILFLLLFTNLYSYSQPKVVEEKSDSIAISIKDTLPEVDLPNEKLDSIEAEKAAMQHKIDSLKVAGVETTSAEKQLDNLNQLTNAPSEKVQELSDRANQKVVDAQDKVDAKVDDAKGTVDEKVSGAENKVANTKSKAEEKLGGAGNKLSNNVGGVDIDKPELDAKVDVGAAVSNPVDGVEGIDQPDVDLPETPNVDMPETDISSDMDLPEKLQIDIDNPVEEDMKDVSAASKKEIDQVKNNKELNKAKEGLGEAKEISSEGQEYVKDVKKVKEEGVEGASEVAEDELKKTKGFEEVQQQTEQTEALKSDVEKYQSEEAMKANIKRKTQNLANDLIAQNRDKIADAQKVMSKYKKKYSEIQSIKDFKEAKKKPNPLKDKTFKERLVPGFTVQVQQQEGTDTYIGPYIGYKLNHRFTSYFGVNYRLRVSNWEFLPGKPVYGVRHFTDYKIWEGFYLHGEWEVMQTWGTYASFLKGDNQQRWVHSVMGGLGKEFNFLPGVNGHMLMMHNFTHQKYSPYARKFIFRLAFTFDLKEKQDKEKVRKVGEEVQDYVR